MSMYLSPGGFQLASGVGLIQPDPTARGCGLTSGSDADPWLMVQTVTTVLGHFVGWPRNVRRVCSALLR
jgi:hypothetical protein